MHGIEVYMCFCERDHVLTLVVICMVDIDMNIELPSGQ